TGATGVTIYRGDAWPAPYRGQAFVGDVGSNIVHRKLIEPDGVGLIARRADEKKEFVASTDIWFRPAQFVNAPDGNLYIIDVYREVIEHPGSLPPVIKKPLDVTLPRLADDHPRVREHAIRLAETLAAASAEIRERLVSLADDADPRVRYQLAFTLGVLPVNSRTTPLAKILKRDGGDRWVR